MNDPHVEKLHYRIKHDHAVDYDDAPLLVRETPLFTAHIGGDRAMLEMRKHFGSEEEAKGAVAPLLRAWEVWAGLERGPGEFEFTYVSCDLVDRRPDPGKVTLNLGAIVIASGAMSVRIHRGTYPEAHDCFEVSPDVELMYSRYKQYKEGKEKLTDFAYFIYTAVKGGSRKQQSKPAKRLGIDDAVFTKLNTLSSERGGPADARKYEGVTRDFTDTERRWLEKVVKVIVQRVGEVAADPTRNRPQITMDDLPDL